MKQVSQEMKKGTMHVEEVPDPALKGGGVIVRNEYSRTANRHPFLHSLFR
jgi:NADPH:quinone reductase-like Zn-dependent oxidoreductase